MTNTLKKYHHFSSFIFVKDATSILTFVTIITLLGY